MTFVKELFFCVVTLYNSPLANVLKRRENKNK